MDYFDPVKLYLIYQNHFDWSKHILEQKSSVWKFSQNDHIFGILPISAQFKPKPLAPNVFDS